MLMGAGYGIGNHSFETLRELASGAGQAPTPTRLTAVAATISIIAKEALFRVGTVPYSLVFHWYFSGVFSELYFK